MNLSQFYGILIDIGALCFLGFLYYVYQKRKILRHETERRAAETEENEDK